MILNITYHQYQCDKCKTKSKVFYKSSNGDTDAPQGWETIVEYIEYPSGYRHGYYDDTTYTKRLCPSCMSKRIKINGEWR